MEVCRGRISFSWNTLQLFWDLEWEFLFGLRDNRMAMERSFLYFKERVGWMNWLGVRTVLIHFIRLYFRNFFLKIVRWIVKMFFVIIAGWQLNICLVQQVLWFKGNRINVCVAHCSHRRSVLGKR